ncbi:MAG: glycosyltransferase family 39 protein [Bacteroidota bacterium]
MSKITNSISQALYQNKVAGILLMATMAFALVYRMPQLDAPLCYDEAFSYIHYASNPWPDPVFLYDYPNNHILHTIAMKFSVDILGLSHFSLRLPALFGGLILVVITFLISRKTYGLPTAAMASFLIAISSTMVIYSTNGRGYSMMACCVTLIWYSLHRMVNGVSKKHFIILVMLQSAACMISPVALLGIAVIHFYIYIKNRKAVTFLAKQQVNSLVCTLLISALFYLPAVLFTKEFNSDSIVSTTLPNLEKVKEMLHFIEGSFQYTIAGMPFFLMIVLGAGFIWGSIKEQTSRIALASFFIFAMACWILPIQPPPLRSISILLPLVYILISKNIFKALEKSAFDSKLNGLTIALVLIAATLITHFKPTIARDQYDVTPVKNHMKLFTILKKEMKNGDTILTQFPMEASVRTYSKMYGLQPNLLSPENAYSGKTTIVLNRKLNQTETLSFEKNNIDEKRFLKTHRLEKSVIIDENTLLLLYSRTDQQ